MRILYTALNWGLGHATRSVPVIKALKAQGAEVVLAADGQVKEYWNEVFPNLEFHLLPDIEIRYPRHRFLAPHLIFQIPQWKAQVNKDLHQIARLTDKLHIDGIISDNRYGARHPELPSVLITHQLEPQVSAGKNLLRSYLRNYIRPFSEVWIPDVQDETSLAGDLIKPKSNYKHKFIGWLSALERFPGENNSPQGPFLFLLSGPEMQRTRLENQAMNLILKQHHACVLVRGTSHGEPIDSAGHLTVINLAAPEQLSEIMHEASVVFCRSGYSSLMDLLVSQKRGFLNPTPGQPEQIYLARRMEKLGWFGKWTGNETSLEQLLNQAKNFSPPQVKESELLNETVRDWLRTISL